MSRLSEAVAVLLLVGAALAFGFGLRALGTEQDFRALYLLLVGALSLRASTEMMRPRGSGS